MAKVYYNIRPHTVLEHFRGVEPCNCHRDNPYNPPFYNVKTSTGTEYGYSTSGPIIKEISIVCSSCGRTKTTNVENYGVYENEFNPS